MQTSFQHGLLLPEIGSSQHKSIALEKSGSKEHSYWPKWDSMEILKFNFSNLKWEKPTRHLKPTQKFLFFSSLCHVAYGHHQRGLMILGGSDAEDNFSKRVTYFDGYERFEERAPLIFKRAFFPSIQCSNSHVYSFGGNDGQQDLRRCEKYDLENNHWAEITPMKIRRNGSSGVSFDKFVFIFGGNNDSGSLDSIERY